MAKVELTGEIIHKNASNLSIEVERGQRGGYGWTIKVYGCEFLDVADQIKAIDSSLRATYLNGGQIDTSPVK
jgi:hypothetical protein